MRDRTGKSSTAGDLVNVLQDFEDLKQALDYYERQLEIAKEVGDWAAELIASRILGEGYLYHRDFKKAISYFDGYLKIAKHLGDRVFEGNAYRNLAQAYGGLGDFKTAIRYHERDLKIAIDVGDKAREGSSCENLGNAYHSLGDFKTAINYHERHLKIAQELDERAEEGSAYCNLGIAHQRLGNVTTGIAYHERELRIYKEGGDRDGEGRAYGNLGIAHQRLGDFKKALEYHQSELKIAKEEGDRSGEGSAYGNLGIAHYHLGDLKKAIDYHKHSLRIAQEVGDKMTEGSTYGNLGNAYHRLGDFKTAIDYHKRDLQIAKAVGNKAEEGSVYCNLGNAYRNLRDYKTALDYYQRDLKISKEVGDRAGEGTTCGNIGITHESLGDFRTAIAWHERRLEIAKEVGDKSGEANACGNLGNAHHSLGDFKRAIDYHERSLKLAQDVGDNIGLASSFYGLGRNFESQGSVHEALDCYQRSVTTFNDVRDRLQFKDEWTISLRDMYQMAYASLTRVLLKQGEVLEALFSAEKGRAQALKDLMESKYAFRTTDAASRAANGSIHDMLSCLPSNTVFIAIEKKEVIFWVCQKGKDVELRRKTISNNSSCDDVTNFFQSLMEAAYQEIDARADVKCEDRSLDNLANERSPPQNRPTQYLNLQISALTTFFDTIISPIQDLLLDNELVFVPEGTLCLAPFAAFIDSNSKYLCESYRIRVIPSLTSLKLIADCPERYHSKTGALLVGDPWVKEATNLQQLPCAKEEVQMIGRILGITPLIGRQATKNEVLKQLSTVALVHIAAHGRMETGEIALSPNPTSASRLPVEEDFVLTMRDVSAVQVRARLVVLSCCHSARGEIKAEGVVGIARAFLGAGARSVLVSLWAIDDEATLEFMKSFYLHLVKGKSTSEALNQAMKCMRESDEFSAVKYWAPFVLIGDDVTLKFDGRE